MRQTAEWRQSFIAMRHKSINSSAVASQSDRRRLTPQLLNSMKPKLRPLTPEEFPAVQAAAFMHGRNFKSVIRDCWSYGTYEKHCLGNHDGTLQRMRNSGDGREVLASLRVKDFCATPAVAFIMGKNAFILGGQNPFGIAAQAEAWRKGYTAAKQAERIAEGLDADPCVTSYTRGEAFHASHGG